MAAPVNANINVLVNTQQAMAQLRALQGQIATLNGSLSATSGSAAAQQAALAKGLRDSANASRMWQARIVPMNTAVQQFSTALDKGRMSLGQYTRYAASQLPGMSRVFKREFEMMNRVATQNVKQMQTQYVALGQSATGAAQAMALTPTALNKQAAATAIAAQRQMMMNRMIDLGTTKLLNWGKNTQWAGRQLMVGFSIPLAMVGAVAAKAFKEIDKGSIAFKRVYGDLSTTTAEMERNLDAVKALGQEYTKYGLGLADIIELSADVAATGAKNESLMAATEQTLRLATLGLMEYGEALDATIALQTAFQVSNEDLAGTIDFLNVVENETILTMQDMAAAIPRVAPVVRGLGGDVKDLAVFMTAMREGGVTAEQGANALKSGLGRLINPTKAAREVMDGFGLSIDAIIQSNRGDLMGMVQSFGDALSTLGEFEQQQVLEKVFGKYQYARLGALFKNLSNDASQAQRTIELTNMSMEDLAAISERELGKIEEATSTKFQAAIERLKISIAPVGEQFMKALMPVIDFVTKIANKFNDLPDSIKNAIAIGVAAIAGIGPVVLMTVGLIANGIANIGKLMQTMRKFFARLKGDASLFNYLTLEEREAATAANALSGTTDTLTGKFLGQARALESLIVMVGRYATALSSAAAAAPLGFGMGAAANVARTTAMGTTVTGSRAAGTTVVGPGGMKMAKGGIVPGTGSGDTVPAMLTPGESIVTKEATKKYGPMIQAMNDGTIPGFVDGVTNLSGSYLTGAAKPISPIAVMQPAAGGNQSSVGVSRSQFMGPLGQASFAAAGKAAVDFATRMQTLSRFSMSALQAFDPLDDLFNRMHTEISSQLRTSQTIDEAMAKAKPNVDKILSEYMKQKAISGELTATEGKRLRIATRLLLGEQSTIARVGGLARAERVDVRGGEASRIRTQTVQMPGAAGAPLSTFRRMPDVTEREFARRGLQTPSGFGSYQRSHLMSIGAIPMVPGMISPRVQGRGLSELDRQSIQQAAMSGTRVGTAVADSADRAMGNRSPSVRAQQSVTQYVDGLEVGAAKNTGDAAKAGKVVGNSFAASVKQSIMAGKTAPGLIPGAAKREYMAAQSASRREAYNIREMQRIGMTDAQIIRQLDRLKASKEKQAQAQEKQARLAQANASLANRNAILAQQTNKQMVVEEQARKRGLRARVSDYFGAPVGDGSQTRGQAIRGRMAGGAGGAVMGLMGLSMAASMAGGSVGEMAQKIMPVTMGLMGLQMVIPMLTNPIGLAILAIGGLTAGFIYLRKQLDDAAKEAANVGANMNGVANAMKVIEDATGFVAPKAEDRLFRFTDKDREAMAEFGSYFESEAGSKFIEELKNSTSEERYQKVSRLLAQGIASGLDPEKAKAFGFAIAEATGDTLLKSGIARDFANQIFQSGSQALINLETQRFSERPNAPTAPDFATGVNRLGTLGRTSYDPMGAAAQTAATAAVGTAAIGGMISLGLALTGIGTAAIPVVAGLTALAAPVAAVAAGIWGFVDANSALKESTEEAALAMGYALETTKNLANAEAVLEEERRKGLIDFPEYEKRKKEIDDLQADLADYFGRVFDAGADMGAMSQALGDQLALAGFDQKQIEIISEKFNPDALAQLFYEKDFGELESAQKQYVQEVFQSTMSGLTPENVTQRLADVEGTYKDISQRVLDAAINGVLDVEGLFNEESMGRAISSILGNRDIGMTYAKETAGAGPRGRAARPGETVLPSDIMAATLSDLDVELKKIGTDSFEVLNRLMEFTDVGLVEKILGDPDLILKLGDAVSKLEGFENISIEFIMDNDIDIDELVSQLNQIKNIKFDKKKFGKEFDDFRSIILNALPSADEWAQTAMELGVPVEQLFSNYKDGAEEVGKAIIDIPGKTREAFTKAGKIKPKLTVSLITTLLGGVVPNPGAAAARIANAVDTPLTPLQLMIMVSLGGEGAALLQNKDFLAAAKAGKNIEVATGYSAGRVITETTQFTKEQLAFGKTFLDAGKKPGPAGEKPPKDETSGAGSETKSWLEDLSEEISSNLQLFVGNVSKSISPLMGQIRSKFKGMEIPTRILEMIGAGPEGVKRAKELLGLSKDQMKKLIKDFIRSTGAEAVQGLKIEIGQTVRKTKAAKKLSGENEETRDIILEDQALVDVIATYKKSSPEYTKAIEKARRLARARKELAEITKEEETAEEKLARQLGLQQDAFDRFTTAMEQGFDAAEIAAADKVAGKFFNDNTGLAEKLAESTGHTVTNGYELAGAIERQVSLNQRLIDQEQERIDQKQEEINDYERTNSLIQQGIDDLKRNDEIRNRRSESLSRDLEQIAQAEEKIRESYEKRIDELEKVSAINQHLINQQRKQLDLSRAISEGDIYAATQAAQEMRAASAQQAVDQRRAALQRGMDLAVEGLTNEEGMTRAQIEEEINNIKEQNYQNSLLIRIEEDKIYQNSLEIRRLTNEIYDINEDIIEPLQNQNSEYQRMLDYYKEDEEYAIKRVTLAGLTREEFEKQANALQTAITNAEKLDPYLESLAGRYREIWTNAKNAADEAARLARLQGEETKKKKDEENKFAGGMMKKYAMGGMINARRYTSNEPPPAQMSIGGSVFGSGARDSVAAMLTPGEFVVRKAMVDKYGATMMNALNQGSFAMPKYNVGEDLEAGIVSVNNNVSNINAPVYNTYDMKFSISGANQSADEIANKVMFKMKQLQGQGIRSNRGY